MAFNPRGTIMSITIRGFASLVFVGEAYEAEIEAGGERLLARVDPDARFQEGDAVGFRLDPEHCLLVAD